MHFEKSIPAAILSVFAAGCATAGSQATSAPETGTQACVAKAMEATSFSGVVSIVRPGQTIALARGLAGGPGSAALTLDTRFNLASSGKMFTAVAVAQLVDAGKISLDDPIGRHVTGLTPEASAVTVRQLLTHSGGMGNFFTPDTLAVIGSAQSLSELKPLVASERPAFEPGARFAYSNSGFLLLGMMVEQVSGETYGDYLDRHVFTPAGMTSSTLVPGPTTGRALGMTNVPEPSQSVDEANAGTGPTGALLGPPGPRPGPERGMMPPPGPLRPAAEAAIRGHAAGGGYSTAADMQRFLAALLGGRLTSPAMRDMLIAPQILEAPGRDGRAASHYGLGFSIRSSGQHTWVGHPGGTLGVSSEARAYLAEDTTVVVLANRDPPAGSGEFLRAVLPVLLDGASCEG